MYSNKIGVMDRSFRLGTFAGIEKAASLGANGVQIYAVRGEIDPDNLDAAKRRELLNHVKGFGMVVTALCGDLGPHGFARAEDNAWRIEKSKRIIDLAVDLDTKFVTTHIGVVPENPQSDKYKVMQEACEQLGEYAGSLGRFFAIETGPEKTEVLKGFLDSLSTRNVCVNYDPANLVMVAGDDPVQGVYTLKDYIVHTHAKDGIMKKSIDPDVVYHQRPDGKAPDVNIRDYFAETPLGHGGVDFDRYLAALVDIDYCGFLTIEREVGEKPEDDISEAIRFLREKCGILQK